MKKQLIHFFSFISAFALGSYAFAETFPIPGSANIFGAGHTIAPGPSGFGGGTLPPVVPVEGGRSYSFSVSGTVSPNILYYPPSPYAGADGGIDFAPTAVQSYDGISGIYADTTMCLVGVFVDDSTPADPAPSVLNFSSTGLGTGFQSLSPALNQTFFIGDGLTGISNGVVQHFYAPNGATRLFLGFADGYAYGTLSGQPGFYSDNDGELNVTVSGSAPIDCETALANANATIAALNNQLTQASNLLAAVNLENQHLENTISNFVWSETLDLRKEFKSPSFTIPGETPENQLSNLIAALQRLNHGEKLAIYKKLNTTVSAKPKSQSRSW